MQNSKSEEKTFRFFHFAFSTSHFAISEGSNSRKGFTLLEVLVATAILGIAIAVILQLFAADLRAVSQSKDYVSAATRAEVRMKEILDDDKISEKYFTEATVDGYRIDVSISDTLKERTEALPVKLLEIDLTIRWFRGKAEKSMTLRTLKVVKKEV